TGPERGQAGRHGLRRRDRRAETEGTGIWAGCPGVDPARLTRGYPSADGRERPAPGARGHLRERVGALRPQLGRLLSARRCRVEVSADEAREVWQWFFSDESWATCSGRSVSTRAGPCARSRPRRRAPSAI